MISINDEWLANFARAFKYHLVREFYYNIRIKEFIPLVFDRFDVSHISLYGDADKLQSHINAINPECTTENRDKHSGIKPTSGIKKKVARNMIGLQNAIFLREWLRNPWLRKWNQLHPDKRPLLLVATNSKLVRDAMPPVCESLAERYDLITINDADIILNREPDSAKRRKSKISVFRLLNIQDVRHASRLQKNIEALDLDAITRAMIDAGIADEAECINIEARINDLLSMNLLKYLAFERLIQIDTIDVAMMFSDKDTTSLMLHQALQMHGGASVYCQPAMINNYVPYRHNEMEYAILIDESARKVITSSSIPIEKTFVVGCARFDQYADLRKKRKPALPHCIVIATQPHFSNAFMPYIDALLKALDPNQYEFVIRPHPRENPDVYTPLISQVNVQLNRDGQISDLLVETSLLISGFSNVILEAAIMDIPAIQLKLHTNKWVLPFHEWGIALGVDRPEDLPVLCRQLLDQTQIADSLASSRKSFFYSCPDLYDGTSGQGVKNAIDKIFRRVDSHASE
ncbi:hypothetical protein JXA32_11520 [Candidatus Sumerlaeota bacterium]|nr:hypothetical protein [Candidatus Sumerlaeota bacterium]